MNKLFAAGIVALIAVSFFIGQSAVRAEEGDGMGNMKMSAWRETTEEHAALAKTVGEFDVETEIIMAPGAAPMKGKATAKREMIMNGNYLQETYKAKFMGEPFEGRLTAGYDSVRKKHVTIWIDNMSPVPYVSYGDMKDGKLVLMGKGPDMAGTMEGKKMVLDDGNADTWTVTFYDIKADGKEHMSMRLKYTRKAK